VLLLSDFICFLNPAKRFRVEAFVSFDTDLMTEATGTVLSISENLLLSCPWVKKLTSKHDLRRKKANRDIPLPFLMRDKKQAKKDRKPPMKYFSI
jgi:hypothetical protein